MSIRSFARLAALAVAFVPFAAPLHAQGGTRAVSHFDLGKRGLALQGYDPVAYRPEGGGKPMEGKDSIQLEFGGALYRFANETNREAFARDPERYEARFGGWCAWAMVDGDKVEVDPESFLIEDDELLVFYDGWFGDTREKWLAKGGENLLPKAVRKWSKITGAHMSPPVATIEGEGLGGYDPTTYVSGKAPTPGAAEHTTTVAGVRYRFASVANRATFLRTPDRFLPAYGAHDAFALASGELAPGDPTVFTKQGDALVIFATAANRDAWNADARAKAKADAAWKAKLARRADGR